MFLHTINKNQIYTFMLLVFHLFGAVFLLTMLIKLIGIKSEKINDIDWTNLFTLK